MKYILFLGILMLAACQQKVGPMDQAPLPPASAVDEAADPVKAEEPVVIEPPKPRFMIENILGLAPDTLRKILGEPSLLRQEKDAEVWLYRNGECVMHLFFYPDDNGDYRLDFVEAQGIDLSADNPTVSPNACLDSHVLNSEAAQEAGSAISREPSSPAKGTDPQTDRSGS